jgi:hypothetical protein
MLDADLALLYGVSTKALLQAVKRNVPRFPSDFAFRLNDEERIGMGRPAFRSGCLHGTWCGDAVERLAKFSRRAFVQLRRLVLSRAEFETKLSALERRYDARFRAVFEAIRRLMAPESAERRPIGFRALPERKRVSDQRSGVRRLRATKARMRSWAAAPVLSAAP